MADTELTYLYEISYVKDNVKTVLYFENRVLATKRLQQVYLQDKTITQMSFATIPRIRGAAYVIERD